MVGRGSQRAALVPCGMGVDVIVLNGGSSSGVSSIARRLQAVLARPWLTFGVDDLVRALPPQGITDGSLLSFRSDGLVTAGPGFRQLEDAWYRGVAAIARSGTGVIVDEVFLGGGRSQLRLGAALSGLEVLWVGVHCSGSVAAARERRRPDRIDGMAEAQAELVHAGVGYDLTVDTTGTSTEACAAVIHRRVTGRP